MLHSDIDPTYPTLEDDGSAEPAPMEPGFVIAIVLAAAVVIVTALVT